MPLIHKESKKEKVKAEISARSLEEIHDYMKWSDISDISYFLEECANYTMKSDKEWKKYKKKSQIEMEEQ